MDINEIYEKCPNIIFLPFIGENYGKKGSFFSNNTRLLILGDSFYCQNKICQSLHCNKELVLKNKCHDFYIKEIIDWHIKSEKKWIKPLITCEKAFFNREPSDDERDIFWNSCCFYNYFTEPLDNPSSKLEFKDPHTFNRSLEAFKEVLNYLHPEAIICWGKRTYDELPKYGHQESSITKDNITALVWYYPYNDVNGGVKVLCHSPHPSMPKGNSYEKWHYIYKEFLSEF